jgi:hypothetical protein
MSAAGACANSGAADTPVANTRRHTGSRLIRMKKRYTKGRRTACAPRLDCLPLCRGSLPGCRLHRGGLTWGAAPQSRCVTAGRAARQPLQAATAVIGHSGAGFSTLRYSLPDRTRPAHLPLWITQISTGRPCAPDRAPGPRHETVHTTPAEQANRLAGRDNPVGDRGRQSAEIPTARIRAGHCA